MFPQKYLTLYVPTQRYHIQNNFQSVADTRLQITSFVEDVNRTRHPYLDDHTWPYREISQECRKSLANLRLVSRSFCRSASRPFFRHFQATIEGQCPDSRPLERLLNLSNSAYAVYVRRLEVGVDCSGDSNHEALSTCVEDVAATLPACLARFTNLNVLQFHGSLSCCSRGTAGLFRDTVITALRYVPLSNLTDLDVTFPIAYDFGLFLGSKATVVRIPIENVLRRLRHLGLFLSEYTTRHGQRYWPTAVSAENAALPNNTHAIHLCRSTDILNLDNMNLHNSLHLKSLYLKGVSISSHVLISLIEQCKDTITSIELRRVELNSDTWQQVLLRMSRLSNLLDFVIDSSGYSRDGASSHLRPGRLPPPDYPEDIETYNFLDIYALGNVQRRVNTNRLIAGLPRVSDFDYRHIQRETLETVMEEMNITS
ncbi:uncharacterized protein B0I36DRAFT_257122 [Microdochium trichocladiopsis]|uniref:Uncharacterized protein n=1 Tax=Microdochium trichocladiopsis TaxID=1682393 RepID=A0A9P9BHH0_9PEZI|nr:uncharacterized protein B0I36DRAFT_257122 [Microdochium trichocladiopsis]KAH7010820.1 hypothetical protein B0I36DRAFT_257122 [Microdochium trichocladiopsis]